MYRFWPSIVLAIPLFAGDPLFELTGRIAPPGNGLVSLFGATAPLQATCNSATPTSSSTARARLYVPLPTRCPARRSTSSAVSNASSFTST